MGYYPTPLPVVDRIASFLEFPDENVTLLDPCCGDGAALSRLAQGRNAETYGIELDQHRAGLAREALDHVLACGYEDARITNAAFSGLFLNPPYDWAEAGETERSERKEGLFLRGTARYLRPGGVLVYIVPQTQMRNGVARFLSYRFQNFSAFRFPGEHYDEYRQIVLFGVKKRRGELAGDDFERLQAIPRETLSELPCLDSPRYSLPPGGEVRLFRSTLIDEEELEQELRASPLWERLRYDNNSTGKLGRPPLPLHAGHLGLLLASGQLDGVVGDGDDRHVVRGKVEKVVHRYQEYEGERRVEIEVERYQVSIKLLRQDGRIVTLM